VPENRREQLAKLPEIAVAYRQVFETAAGREVLEDLESIGYIHSSTFVPGDPNETACNEGTRRLVLHIQNMLRLEPEQLTRQLKGKGRGR